MSHARPGDGLRCDHCDTPGVPYIYRDRWFCGLHANRGELLCPACLGIAVQTGYDEPYGYAQVPRREYVSVLARGSTRARR